MNYWLVKTEPESYAWQQFVKEGSAIWDGVRNYQACAYLKKMKTGDMVLFYHSGKEKSIAGVARVSKEAFPDPSSDDSRWVAVMLAPERAFKNHVTLQQIKEKIKLKDVLLLRQSRLSVMPLTPEQFDEMCETGQ